MGAAGAVGGCSGCGLWAAVLAMNSSLTKPGVLAMAHGLLCWVGMSCPKLKPQAGILGDQHPPKGPSTTDAITKPLNHFQHCPGLRCNGLTQYEKPTTNCSRASLGPTHYHLKNKCMLNISKNILTHKMLSILFHHSSLLRDHCFHYMSLIRAPGSVLRPA